MTLPELAKIALDGAALVLSVSALAVAYQRTRRQDVDARFSGLDARLQALEHDNVDLKAVIGSVPRAENLHALQLSLSELHGELRVLGANVSGQTEIMRRLEKTVGRHDDHLLEDRRK